MQEQKPVRYYIVKSDDKPVVRSVPVARPLGPAPLPSAPGDPAPRVERGGTAAAAERRAPAITARPTEKP